MPVAGAPAAAREREPWFSPPTAAALLACAALVTITTLPLLRATLAPPRDKVFIGTFFYKGDFYNYLSFVRQSEEGSFLFENKLLLTPHPPALINLEWWLVGRLSVVLGGRPLLAYRLLGAVAALGLLLAMARWLARAGLPDSHQMAALLLVSLGGGLGGLLHAWRGWPIDHCLDLASGFFPFTEALFNPHFLVGTALLAWGLLLLSSDRPREQVAGVIVGTVLGLSRPYDVILLVMARTLGVVISGPARGWIRRLLPLLGLIPVFLYDAWVFLLLPWFKSFQQTAPFPPRAHLIWALGPAIVLSVPAWRRCLGRGAASPAAAHLLAWPVVAAVIAAANPVSFSLNFLQGSGGAWLGVAALGLQRFRPWVTLVAALVFSSTAWVATDLTLNDDPYWLAAKEDMQLAWELRRVCRSGEVVFSPPDVGLFATGISSCRGVVSHSVADGYKDRLQDVARFYVQATAGERAALLDRYRAAHVVWPGDAPAEDWLGPGTRFRKNVTVMSRRGPVSLYSRP